MARNGAGVYSLPAVINPVVIGTTIDASWANTTLTDVANALTASIAADGQTVPTANLPMAGRKHTGAADAATTGEYVNFGQNGWQLGAGAFSGAVSFVSASFSGSATFSLPIALASGSTAVTQAITDNSTQVATTSFVSSAITSQILPTSAVTSANIYAASVFR